MARMDRRLFVTRGAGLGAGLAASALIGGRPALALMIDAGGPPADAVPAAPSPQADHVYRLLMAYRSVRPVTSARDFVRRRRAALQAAQRVRIPSAVSIVAMDAGGVPAQMVRATGAATDRVILYLHGGGFYAGVDNFYRVLAAELSRASGLSVLLPDYRLIPEHPFPAALDDCVAVYRWLRRRGSAATRVAIAGDSAGANLTLATALVLHGHGEPLPTALVAQSAPTDLALTGASYRTKAGVDPFNSAAFVRAVAMAYTGDGATSVRNPLVSPLYADLRGLPPTLIQVGTREVLLDDSTRLAARMRAAGDAVTLEVWPGMWHGWPLTGISLPFPEATLTVQHIAQFVRRSMRP